MSFPRLVLLALGLPLLAGGCAGAAVTAASYGADGTSYMETGKTTSDHFISMISKKDCALWRVFRNQKFCYERPPGAKDPYNVSYDTAERMPSEDGGSYAPPLHQTADEPATAWSADAYAKKPESAAALTATPAPEPAVATTEPVAPSPPAEEKPVAPKSTKKKAKVHAVAHATPVKKPSPDQAASVP
jgi:hypothetical protein